jgi:hypothetical protein
MPRSIGGGVVSPVTGDGRSPVKGGAAWHAATAYSSLLSSFFSCPSTTSLAPYHARSRESCATDGGTEEGGCAAAGPLAGVRVPREGERAAVERPCDGAPSTRVLEKSLRGETP